jgi:hypothetical protein
MTKKNSYKMYVKNLMVTHLLYFWRYLTLFEPPDDDIKRRTGSSHRNIQKTFLTHEPILQIWIWIRKDPKYEARSISGNVLDT